MQPEIILDAQATLGEGPAWDARTRTLYWIDIVDKRIHYHRNEEDGFIQLDVMPGCLAPARDGSLIVAAHASILAIKPLAQTHDEPAIVTQTVLASVSEPANNRFNDGKCDPAGRFLAGTMDMGEKIPGGALHSFDGSQVTRLLEGVCISNGLAWSSDHETFYHIDTPTREVKAFDYDLATGQIANPRVVICVPEALGWPDGMTSDMDGNLWIAMWSGAQVTRWNPRTGRLLEQIPLPAKLVTSCVFGGENLNELYITSARRGLDQADLTAYRYSGSLMRVKTRVQGMPTFEFG
jgi:sugar lactone lactonase YvrE